MIEDLLKELRTKYSHENQKREREESLQQMSNSKEIWSGIGSGESFAKLGFASKEELDQWIASNPYSSMS